MRSPRACAMKRGPSSRARVDTVMALKKKLLVFVTQAWFQSEVVITGLMFVLIGAHVVGWLPAQPSCNTVEDCRESLELCTTLLVALS